MKNDNIRRMAEEIVICQLNDLWMGALLIINEKGLTFSMERGKPVLCKAHFKGDLLRLSLVSCQPVNVETLTKKQLDYWFMIKNGIIKLPYERFLAQKYYIVCDYLKGSPTLLMTDHHHLSSRFGKMVIRCFLTSPKTVFGFYNVHLRILNMAGMITPEDIHFWEIQFFSQIERMIDRRNSNRDRFRQVVPTSEFVEEIRTMVKEKTSKYPRG